MRDVGYAGEACAPTRTRLDVALGDLDLQLNELYSELYLLEDRVAPVMRPPEPAESMDKQLTGVSSSSPTTEAIDEFTGRVAAIRRRLGGVLSRLDT